MTKAFKVLAAVAVGLLALACTKEETQLSLSDKAANFEPSGNLEKVIKVTCSEGWSVSATEDWVKVDPSSGNGSGSFKIIVEENKSVSERTANVKVSAGIKSETVKVTQLGVTPVVSVQPAKADFEAAGGEQVITVTANLPWTISVPEADTWLSAVPANDNKTFKITVQENTSLESRNSTVTVSVEGKSAPVEVSQLGLQPALEVSPAEVEEVSREGTTIDFTVTANVPWELVIPEEASWITADVSEGDQSAAVKVTVAPNNTALDGRSAEITFKLKDHEISAVIAIAQQEAVYNPETDKLALLAIYEASDGANWAKNNWDLTAEMSTWSGVTVDATPGRVTAVKLTTAGTIVKDWTLPEVVGWLTEVTDFRVNGNKLTGALPESLFTLPKLQKL